MELILASASPRRKELLEKIGLPFTVQPAKGGGTHHAEKPCGGCYGIIPTEGRGNRSSADRGLHYHRGGYGGC